ncbi:MAG: hypothetical protein FD161_3894 [Limisphaerales bacterium]|nr:MAG: hypothetical protein FD161_3894 [Limisphaerales bacterium]KAG0507344.1 MAG: hypothetical protein E1N63_3491 [Limisphaerales bacterium]TXT51649.1 MAG: hypothetical protein FD140_1453 [Limisphaerales bacterium]
MVQGCARFLSMDRELGRKIMGRKIEAEIFLPTIFLPTSPSGSWSQCAASGPWRLPGCRKLSAAR